NGQILLIQVERAAGLADLHHLNVLIGTVLGAGGPADTRVVVDDHLAADRAAMDRASRATDHADRIHTVHAGIGDHEAVVLVAVAQKAWIVVMGGSAGAHAVIAAGATVQVHHHGSGAVEETIVHEKLDHLWLDSAMQFLQEFNGLRFGSAKNQLLERL